jgi:hypothetical protein
MALTTKQIYDLNNMNVAAQHVALGTILSNIDDNTMASGSFLPDAAVTPVDTGLSTVRFAVASLSGSPTLTHNMVSAASGSVAGYIWVKCWMPTNDGSVTPVAATGTTGFAAVSWIAIGDL